MRKQKKGFTLLELLAVIVIIALIVLITIPIIINVIEEARKKSILESAKGYFDAIEKSILVTKMENEFTSGEYYIKDNDLYDDLAFVNKKLKVNVKGKTPDDGGMIIISEGVIVSCEDIYISGYPIMCNKNNITIGKKGEIPIKLITITEKDIIIGQGEEKQLTLQILPASATNKKINWKSSNSDIAKVSDTGVVTGIKSGTITVTATSENKKEAQVKVTVQKSYSLGDIVEVDTIYDLFDKKYKADGEYIAKLSNEEQIKFEMYNIEGNKTYSSTPKLCNSTEDNLMCIYKYSGNLTIDTGVEIKPQVRKKGFVIYVAGTLINNGEISMTARGAKAIGQEVLLYKNSNSTYEKISANGATGGAAVSGNLSGLSGIKGNDGIDRQTGGGGSGGAKYKKNSGSGSNGTSYSGGTGGGGIECSSRNGDNGEANGGAGGRGCANNSGGYELGGGGAGNPGGYAYGAYRYRQDGLTLDGSAYDGGWPLKELGMGESGTGGLLIIYTNNLINNSIINANGSNGGAGKIGGGSSGGGSINIFYTNKIKVGSISSNGGKAVGTKNVGGAGGNGTINTCSIATKICVK